MKNKKSIITVVISLTLLAILGVGSTLAYFSAEDAAKNTFKMGSVKIDLKEYRDDVETDTGFEYENVMPGDKLDKKVFVNGVADTQPAYVAVKVQVSSSDGIAADVLAKLSFKAKEGWTEVYTSDDQLTKVYMYGYTAATGDIAATATIFNSEDSIQVFDHVVVPGKEWGNDEASKRFAIDVQAAAVQSANISVEDAKNELLDLLK